MGLQAPHTSPLQIQAKVTCAAGEADKKSTT